MNITITTYCTIKNNRVTVNGIERFQGINDANRDFLKQLYQYLKLDYPKFYKMDNISKLGILGIELLKEELNYLSAMRDDAIGMVFQTELGCLESDLEHQQNILRNSSSPSVFVYTLSNIVLGEIAIRNKWFGESICLIGKHNELEDLVSYSKSLILNNKAELVIAGTIDSLNGVHEMNLVVLEAKINGESFSEENLKKIIEN